MLLKSVSAAIIATVLIPPAFAVNEWRATWFTSAWNEPMYTRSLEWLNAISLPYADKVGEWQITYAKNSKSSEAAFCEARRDYENGTTLWMVNSVRDRSWFIALQNSAWEWVGSGSNYFGRGTETDYPVDNGFSIRLPRTTALAVDDPSPPIVLRSEKEKLILDNITVDGMNALAVDGKANS